MPAQPPTSPDRINDELESITGELSRLFAGRVDLDHVRAVVHESYRTISSQAAVTAHVIPLTRHAARAHLESEAG
ncbi:three-helix bundle dimerization domain-containing protein [Actinokineospora bangkokensis]|uniref:Protein-tyrosine-phosphatase-like N-terminal domain-containing protein n=1 Tax=Actinokineospora bangkokensis TaxID=1193682 RepID=A0A1Q9LR23_9PSEU|nr:hypothetical protein [Actinokineospora bangkokensis]OLR94470.1 hypothetical protein BJP25_12015 [Actinokineospora bangkokensis]